ncbi:mechanosensitive ion channel family protein [Thalassotalea euphylliae]|uniref:Mechanosensing system component YbdG n=1 Tax=Thalassotalea euphylliae TaxID=1655234 RepID=A0A3E0UKF0_9GAMM|nr:mechanosensitive ion channel family protein [Thalassotalea euphylliae]REL37103.1 mechanosensitive ion channel family protein [Thalassotalea euphylliae]
MQQWISEQLILLGLPNQYLELGTSVAGIVLLLLLASASHYLVKHRLLVLVQKLVQRTKNTWDDLFVTHQVFTKISLLVPFFLIIALTPIFLPDESLKATILVAIARVAVIFQIARVLSALLDVIKAIYQAKAKTRYMPLNATIQLIKLAIYLVATILSVAVIIDRSPIFLLSGLGALTAVLLLIFQDTIKGLVASIQIAANKMVAPGDWVELPQYGADGDVLEIGLNTVKIQNFDRTVTTVPTYALISGSFKNWRDMFNSGGRRIKRAIYIDAASVRFYQAEEIKQLTSIRLLADYLAQKQTELAQNQQQLGSAATDKRNQRQLTNIGTFRAYITAYLQSHPKVHQQMTCMVRQLAPTATGIPLELYLFSNDQDWVNYEGIQADIFDHIYAIAPEFGLRIFQHPTGHDWQRFAN